MSITVTKSPDTVSPIGNEIALELQTDDLFSTAGSKATLTFTFTGIDTTAGHAFVISYGDVALTFTLAASPDETGNQIRAALPAEPVDYWLLDFAAEMMQNYYLKRDFDCVTDTDADTIVFTAKEKGLDYSVAVDSENLDNVAIAALAGVDPVQRENFEIVCITDLNDGGTIRKLSEDRIRPDADGKAIFYLQDLFLPELTAVFTWPEEMQIYYAERPEHAKHYLYQYCELYSDVFRRLSEPAGLVAILGAFDYKMVAGLNDTSYTMLNFITTYKSFLTWQPAIKVINNTQSEKLYFLVYNDVSALKLCSKYYHTDGTSSPPEWFIQVNNVSQYQVYEFMVGPNVIDLTLAKKEVEKYEIWLEDGDGNVQSQVRTFILDTKSYRNERIFLFRNSFGAFDTFRATGRKRQLCEYERMIRDRNDQEFSLQEQYQVLERSVFSCNSGWLTFAQRNWLRELLLSKEVYEIIGNYKFPILITDDKRDFRDDDDYLYSLEINYRYAFKDPAYTGDYANIPLLAENLEILLNEDGAPLFG